MIHCLIFFLAVKADSDLTFGFGFGSGFGLKVLKFSGGVLF